MLEMIHYILRFITTMKHVIYVAVLSAAPRNTTLRTVAALTLHELKHNLMMRRYK